MDRRAIGMKNKANFIIVITAFAVILGAIGGVFYSSAEAEASDKIPLSDSVEPVVADGEKLNFLIGGTDRTSGLTDVLMLVSVDTGTGSVTVMQIPRDTYAKYGKSSYKKINGAYNSLGGEGLKRFISDSMGIGVDGYVILSPDAFGAFVDAVGGVEIELKEPMYYKDPYQGLSISLPKGKQVLDGKRAEQFIRYRSGYVSGDLGRMDAQKVFLTALYKRVMEGLSPVTLARMASAVLGGADTDVSPTDLWFLSQMAEKSSADKVRFITAPGEAVTAKKSGASFYSLSSKGCEEILVTYFGARRGDFDREKVFLNGNNADFSRIYEKYVPYKTYTAENIGKGG